MNSIFLIEKLRLSGKPMATPQFYYELSTAKKPRTTPSIGRAAALDGAHWSWGGAETDASYIRGHSKYPVRIREVKQEVLKYEKKKFIVDLKGG